MIRGCTNDAISIWNAVSLVRSKTSEENTEYVTEEKDAHVRSPRQSITSRELIATKVCLKKYTYSNFEIDSYKG